MKQLVLQSEFQKEIKKEVLLEDDENNSKLSNVDKIKKEELLDLDEIRDEIKIVKKKRKIELPQDVLDLVQVLKMENLMKEFVLKFGKGTFEKFRDHCATVLTKNLDLAGTINDLTVEQADTALWHDLRIGRITASRLYESTRCTMARGSLVDKYLGKKSGWSFAMMRGTVLEEFVFEEIKKDFPELKRAGLIINPKVNPFFAASPDGLHKDFVLEIKCPNTPNTFNQYINLDTLSKKYFAQIQLQMFMTEKTKALLAVAHLDFEKTRKITKLWIDIDYKYLDTMIEEAELFYEKAIFPALKKKFAK